MTKLEFLDKINDILVGLNTLESDLLGSLYDELMRDAGWHPASKLPPVETDIVVWCILDDGQIHVGMASLSEKKWPDALEKYVRWWCYPPEEEE